MCNIGRFHHNTTARPLSHSEIKKQEKQRLVEQKALDEKIKNVSTFSLTNLLLGYVAETKTSSLLGNWIYSDFCVNPNEWGFASHGPLIVSCQDPLLNQCARIPIIGIAAGITRMGLAVIHTLGHLLAAMITWEKGHLIHAIKGGCEFLRGGIEAIPVAGRLFSRAYSCPPEDLSPKAFSRKAKNPQEGMMSWWILKIYNPESRGDVLDEYSGKWSQFKAHRPSAYIFA